jgi:hypothetical protein
VTYSGLSHCRARPITLPYRFHLFPLHQLLDRAAALPNQQNLTLHPTARQDRPSAHVSEHDSCPLVPELSDRTRIRGRYLVEILHANILRHAAVQDLDLLQKDLERHRRVPASRSLKGGHRRHFVASAGLRHEESPVPDLHPPHRRLKGNLNISCTAGDTRSTRLNPASCKTRVMIHALPIHAKKFAGLEQDILVCNIQTFQLIISNRSRMNALISILIFVLRSRTELN